MKIIKKGNFIEIILIIYMLIFPYFFMKLSLNSEYALQSVLSYSDKVLDDIINKSETIHEDVCKELIILYDYLMEISETIKGIKEEILSLPIDKEEQKIKTPEKMNVFLYIVSSINYIKSDLYKIGKIINQVIDVQCDNTINESTIKKKLNDINDILSFLVQKVYEIAQKDSQLNLELVILN